MFTANDDWLLQVSWNVLETSETPKINGSVNNHELFGERLIYYYLFDLISFWLVECVSFRVNQVEAIKTYNNLMKHLVDRFFY